jgi:hypothetical protein
MQNARSCANAVFQVGLSLAYSSNRSRHASLVSGAAASSSASPPCGAGLSDGTRLWTRNCQLPLLSLRRWQHEVFAARSIRRPVRMLARVRCGEDNAGREEDQGNIATITAHIEISFDLDSPNTDRAVFAASDNTCAVHGDGRAPHQYWRHATGLAVLALLLERLAHSKSGEACHGIQCGPVRLT